MSGRKASSRRKGGSARKGASTPKAPKPIPTAPPKSKVGGTLTSMGSSRSLVSSTASDFARKVNKRDVQTITADTHKKGSKLWMADKKNAFVVGEVVAWKDATTLELRSKYDGKLYTHKSTAVYPLNPVQQEGVNDNTALMHLHEPSLLHNLDVRYGKDKIYTYTAYILIAINPYKNLPHLTTEAVMSQYKGKSIGSLPPHPYAIADAAFRHMKSNSRSQSLLISGESGAGKTETAKIIMRYFAVIGGSGGGKLGNLETKILESNPILEAFGNAKTLRNNNSSRFGKYLQINFDKAYKVAGASIVTYLLERSRIVYQQGGERNYHSFYQLLAGASPKERQALKLGPASSFRYTNQGKATEIQGVNDSQDYKDVRAAMKLMGFPPDVQSEIYRIVAAVLHLGNVDFSGNDAAKVKNTGTVNTVADLLGVNQAELLKRLQFRTVKTPRDTLTVPLKINEAHANRDAFAKMIYSRLFDDIVARINASLSGKKHAYHIGVLDIFGFEFFEHNSFEQFCINYANEKLQQHFNSSVLASDQEIYAREGIPWKMIEFDDNSDTIDAIENRPNGVLAILDEQSTLAKATDATFAAKIHSTFPKHKRIGKARMAQVKGLRDEEAFVVNHFAGNVCYEVAGFREKNNDSLHPDLRAVIATSGRDYVKNLFAEDAEDAGGSKRAGPRGGVKRSVTRKFSQQLESLMDELRATHSHFIRCVKPNSAQKPGFLEYPMVMNQLRFNGMVETLRVYALGYPTRAEYSDLYDRYRGLMPKDIASLPAREFTEALLMGLEVNRAEFALGLTRVFFKAGRLAFLDQLLGSDFEKYAPEIVSKVRRYLRRKRFRRAIWVVLTCVILEDILFEARDKKRGMEVIKKMGGIPSDNQLKSWFNHHLRSARFRRVMTNFTTDLTSGEKYVVLMNQIEPERASLKGLDIKDHDKRAEWIIATAAKFDCAPKWLKPKDISRGGKLLNKAFVATLYAAHPSMEPSKDELEAQKRAAELEASMKKIEKSLAMTEAEKKKVEKKAAAEIDAQRKKAMKEITGAKKSAAEAEQRLKATEAEKEAIEKQWSAEIETYKRTEREKANRLQAVTTELKNVKSELETTRFEHDSAMDALRMQMESAVEAARKEGSENSSKAAKLQKEKSALERKMKSEVSSLKGQNAELQEEVKRLQSLELETNAKAEEENKTLRRQLAQLKKVVEAAKAKAESISGERDSLAASLAALRTELDSQMQELAAERSAAQKRAADLQASLKKTAEQTAAAEAKLKKELEVLKNASGDSEAKFKKAKAETTNLRVQLRALEDRKLRLEGELDTAKAEKDGLGLHLGQTEALLSTTKEARKAAESRVKELSGAVSKERNARVEAEGAAELTKLQLQQKVHDAEDRLKLVKGQIGTWKSKLATSEAARAKLASREKELQSRIKDLQGDLSARDKELQEASVTGIGERLAAQKELAAEKKRIEDAKKKAVGKAKKDKAAAEANAKKEKARLEGAVKSLEDLLRAEKDAKNALKAQLSEIEVAGVGEVAAKEQELVTLKAQVELEKGKAKETAAKAKRLAGELKTARGKLKEAEGKTATSAEVDELKSSLESSRAEVAALQSKLKEINDASGANIAKIEAEYKALLSKKEQAAQKSRRVAAKHKAAAEEAKAKVAEGGSKEAIAALENQLKETREEASKVREELQAMKMAEVANQGELRTELVQVKADKKEAEDKFKRAAKDVKALRARVTEAEKKAAALTGSNNAAVDEARAKSQAAALKVSELQAKVKELQAKVSVAEKEKKKAVAAAKSSKEAASSKAESKIEKTESERKAAERRALEAETKLEALTRRAEELEAEVEAANRERDEANSKRLAEMEAMNSKTAKEMERLAKGRTDAESGLKKELKEALAENKSLSKQLGELEIQLEKTNAEKENMYAQADARIQDQAKALANAQEKAAKGEAEVSAVAGDAAKLAKYLVLPEKHGILHKQSPRFKSVWEQRWFSLRSHFLFYYKDSKDQEHPQGVIDLTQCTLSKVPFAAIKKPMTFVLKVKRTGRGFYIAAGSETDLDDWMKQIQTTMNRVVGGRAYAKSHGVTK